MKTSSNLLLQNEKCDQILTISTWFCRNFVFFNVGGGVLLLLVVPLEVERDGLALVQGAETLGIDGGPKSSNNYLIKFWKKSRNCYDLHGFEENNVKNCLFFKISFLSYWWTKTSSEPSAGVMKPKPFWALKNLTVPWVVILKYFFLLFCKL